MQSQNFCVYILTNEYNTVLYTGVTGNLPERVRQHKEGKIPGFTSRYRVNRLVYFEAYPDPASAILREKQIKAGSRKKKEALINAVNPEWNDLSLDFFE
jgi:putative endonuclease